MIRDESGGGKSSCGGNVFSAKKKRFSSDVVALTKGGKENSVSTGTRALEKDACVLPRPIARKERRKSKALIPDRRTWAHGRGGENRLYAVRGKKKTPAKKSSYEGKRLEPA